ncbi:MAG: T9SS type B sorting domain-containing protein, partial [Bacteroidota bacterium]
VYEISLTVSDDSGATSVQSFDLNVVNVNDQPIIVTTPITTINEDEPYSYTIEANDVDVGDVLEFSSDNLPEWLSLVDNGNGTAELSGIPENEDVGTETVRILVTDLSGIKVVQEFDLLISNTNDAPFFTSTPNLRLVVEENYRYSVIADDIDVGDILSISALEVPSFLNFVDNGDGTGVLSGVVPSNPMSLSVELMVEDVAGEQAIQSFTFTVNNAPQVSDIEVLTKEDSVVMLPLTLFEGAYFDLDNDPINGIIIKSLPANGELLSMEGVPYAPGDTLDLVGELLLYHPTLNFSGEDEFMYNIFDGLSTAQDDAQLSFVLESVNDKPVIDNLENDAIEYSLGDPGVAITSQATINDVDDTSIDRVQITIASNYARGDELSLGSEFVNENIESVFDFESGVLTVQGEGSKSNYENILKNVFFSSPVTGEADLSTKRIDIVLDDGEAESDIFSRSIIISEVFPELDIVNAFTPNNDGVNDTWDFVNLQFYTKINISVFDRDGLLVFECNEQDCEWDGTYNSSALPADSYFYTIDLNDGKREYKGVVAILK